MYIVPEDVLFFLSFGSIVCFRFRVLRVSHGNYHLFPFASMVLVLCFSSFVRMTSVFFIFFVFLVFFFIISFCILWVGFTIGLYRLSLCVVLRESVAALLPQGSLGVCPPFSARFCFVDCSFFAEPSNYSIERLLTPSLLFQLNVFIFVSVSLSSRISVRLHSYLGRGSGLPVVGYRFTILKSEMYE